MKRALIAVVAVGFVVAAISIARAHTGDQDTPEARPSATTPDRDIVREQVEQQSDQLRKAQADLAAKVADARANGRQSLTVTLREEMPGDVWTVVTVAGKRTCVGPQDENVTFIEVTAQKGGPTLASDVAPREATLLRGGACQGTLEIFVPDSSQYRITIGGAARGEFEPVDVQGSDRPIEVTIVG